MLQAKSLSFEYLGLLSDRMTARSIRNFPVANPVSLQGCHYIVTEGWKQKFVIVWATIQQPPELREWFRHDHLLSRVLQPAWSFVVFLSWVLQPSWLWFVVKHICCTVLSSTGQSRGSSNQLQSTGKLTGTVVFCSTCVSSTTSTLIWRCCRRSTPHRCASSIIRSAQAKSSWNTATSSICPPHFARTRRPWHGPPSPVFLICKSIIFMKRWPLMCYT